MFYCTLCLQNNNQVISRTMCGFSFDGHNTVYFSVRLIPLTPYCRSRWDHLVDYVFFIAYTPTGFFEDDPTYSSKPVLYVGLQWKSTESLDL